MRVAISMVVDIKPTAGMNCDKAIVTLVDRKETLTLYSASWRRRDGALRMDIFVIMVALSRKKERKGY